MKIMQTKWTKNGAIEIQNHGSAFVVTYPSQDPNQKGFSHSKTFSKAIGSNAWNQAQSFAASKKRETT
jgi:hypothetical protein